MKHLADIFSQGPAIDYVRSAFAAGRLAHGLLFAGPPGVGKSTTAQALAELLLCSNPSVASHPPVHCRQCDSCRLMAAGNHPDLHLIYRQLIRIEKEDSKALALPVDVIQQYLLEPAGLKPMLGHGKVFIIEEAHLMNIAAQNALLKTLEEPAPNSFIILLTEQPDRLLPTIRSRCQRVSFGVIDQPQLISALQANGATESDAYEAALLSEGSLGLAIRWLEDGVLPQARALAEVMNRALAGHLSDPSAIGRTFTTSAEAYAARQLDRDKLASKAQATRDGLMLYLRFASHACRAQLRQPAPPQVIHRTCNAIDALLKAEENLLANVNVSLTFQQLAQTLA